MLGTQKSGRFGAGNIPCYKLLTQQGPRGKAAPGPWLLLTLWKWKDSISAPVRLMAKEGEAITEWQETKTKIQFSNSPYCWWLISPSHHLLHINQIINNFLRDSSLATVSSTRRAFSGKYSLGEQDGRLESEGRAVRALKPGFSLLPNEGWGHGYNPVSSQDHLSCLNHKATAPSRLCHFTDTKTSLPVRSVIERCLKMSIWKCVFWKPTLPVL